MEVVLCVMENHSHCVVVLVFCVNREMTSVCVERWLLSSTSIECWVENMLALTCETSTVIFIQPLPRRLG